MTGSKLSVIIPSYNGKKLLQANLPAVLKACQGAEIIIVDDASTDDTAEYITQTYPQLSLVQLKKNLGFSGAVNAGVKAATGNIVILLNNDVTPTPGFLKPLIKHFNDPSVFATGCREIHPLTGQYRGKFGGRFELGLISSFSCPRQSGAASLWVSGGSGAFRKDLWVKLGGLRPYFNPAYEEDRDLSYRALKLGYKLIFEPESKVYHPHESTTGKVLGQKTIHLTSYKNSLLVIWANLTDPGLILRHLIWLPYHLAVTSFRTRGLFTLGFIMALIHLPQALSYNFKLRRQQKLTDQEILKFPYCTS